MRNSKKNIGKIEEQMIHLKSICELLTQSFNYLSHTEIGAMMHNVLLGVRRLCNSIGNIAEKQQGTLLNVVPFDVTTIKQAIGHIGSDIDMVQDFDIEKRDEEDDTDWKQLIKLENNESPFEIGDSYDEYDNTREFLLKSIRPNYFSIKDKIKEIQWYLRDIEDQTLKIENENSGQNELYNRMYDAYKVNDWKQESINFIQQIKSAIADGKQEGRNLSDTLKQELRALKSEHLNSYMPNHVKALYRTVINERRTPVEVIVKYRNKLLEDDLFDYFSFLLRYKILKENIDSFPLLEPVSGKYESLFTCSAAKDYVDLLSPALKNYGGLEAKEHYGVLLQVMFDLGLARCEKTPYLQMMHYVNERLIVVEEDRFNEQTMIRKTAGALSKVKFSELEFGDVSGTIFIPDKIKEYQTVYWRCFTILNQRGLRMPKEMKLATYLKNPHPSINLNVVMEPYDRYKLIRLQFLRSVLRRETLVFGGMD